MKIIGQWIELIKSTGIHSIYNSVEKANLSNLMIKVGGEIFKITVQGG